MTEIRTLDVAELVLRKHFSLRATETYQYPEILSLHAVANLALTTESPELNRWVRELLHPLISGEATQHMGAYKLYNIGGTGTAKLLHAGVLPEAEEIVRATVEELVNECPRGRGRFLAYQTHNRFTPEQLWIDMVFATCPFLTYAGLHFDCDAYLDEAVTQLVGMHDMLFDPACGLYRQAVNVRGPNTISDDHWSRGNGWGILGLVETATNLPEHIARREEIVRMFTDHLAACLAHQDENGVWHQEMTDPESYVETSGTGLILYALGKALEHGLVDPAWREHLLLGLRSYAGYIALDGSVHNCCIGCLCPGDGSREMYLNRPWKLNDHHAFGPAGLAFGQAYRLGVESLDV
jgi:unsaturated rhamnogalacturonyl hydrolase